MSEGYGLLPRSLHTEPGTLALSDRGYRLMIYAHVGPHSNIIGAFRLPDEYIAGDFNWSVETVRETVSELVAGRFVKRFGDGRHMLLERHREWNTIANPNVMKAALKQLETLPGDPEIAVIFEWLKPLCERFKKGLPLQLETVRKRLGVALRNTETEAEAEIAPETEIESSPLGGEKNGQGTGDGHLVPLAEFAGRKLPRLVELVGGEMSFRLWFGGAMVDVGPPRSLVVRTDDKRDHIARNFSAAVREVIGQDTKIASAESPPVTRAAA